MLGTEVATLIDGKKYSLAYSVDFVTTNLTSGINIYSLGKNDFVKITSKQFWFY